MILYLKEDKDNFAENFHKIWSLQVQSWYQFAAEEQK